MKTKVILLFILVGVLMALALILVKPDTKIEQKNEVVDSYKAFTYVITKIEGKEYYGQSVDGKTKINFNSENVKVPLTDKLEVNDKIYAYVESENHVNGIVRVEKIDDYK